MSTGGTITEAKLAPESERIFKTQNSDLFRWYVTIETANGRVKTSILRKPDSPDPTGLPAELNQKGKWKVASQGGMKGGGGSSKDFKADPVKLRDENRRSALHCAANIAPEGTSSVDILKVAQSFFDWIVAE